MDMLAALLVIGVVYMVVLRNRIVGLMERREGVLSNLRELLRERREYALRLVDSVARYEEDAAAAIGDKQKKVMKDIAVLVGGASRDGLEEDRLILIEENIGNALFRLLAMLGESQYLKSDVEIADISDKIYSIEDDIAMYRREFNSLTDEYNRLIAAFPAIMIARVFNYRKEGFFELAVDKSLEKL